MFRAGLPLGSLLSPLLFLLWAASLVRVLRTVPGCSAYMYAGRRYGHPLCGCNHRDGQKQSAERRRQTGRLGQGVEDDRLCGEDASPRPIPVGPRHGGPLHQGGWSCGDGSRDAQPARCLAGSPTPLRPPLQTSEGAHLPPPGAPATPHWKRLGPGRTPTALSSQWLRPGSAGTRSGGVASRHTTIPRRGAGEGDARGRPDHHRVHAFDPGPRTAGGGGADSGSGPTHHPGGALPGEGAGPPSRGSPPTGSRHRSTNKTPVSHRLAPGGPGGVERGGHHGTDRAGHAGARRAMDGGRLGRV